MRLLNGMTFSAVVVAVSFASSFVFAKNEAKPPVSVELATFQVITDEKGGVSTKAVDQVKPNDTIEYRATYTNNTDGLIKNLVATLPIPAETQFLAKSNPTAAQASTDGKDFASMPLTRKVGTKVVKVPLRDYRALRWTIAELPAGKSVTVSAQTRVSSTDATGNQ